MKTIRSVSGPVLQLFVFVLLAAPLAGADSAPDGSASNSTTAAPVTVAQASSAPSQAALPPYDFPFKNSLYASAAGFLSIKKVDVCLQKTYLLEVPGICAKFPVKGVIQESSAPLVVILLGVEGRPDDDFSKLWASWYSQAGYHVLTFDSTFIQEFNVRTRHGVTGNVWLETEIAAKIIASFLEQTCVKGRVSELGVVGMSYGGIEALMLGTMAAHKKLPFEINAIQAYSPPISLIQAAKVIDGWHTETLNKYTLVELVKLYKHVPNRECPEPPVDDCMLKAAAAALFRLPLPALIAYNDAEYKLHILPKGDEFDDGYVRVDYATKWSFTHFAYRMSYPYWQSKLNVNIEELVHSADLGALLAQQPASSEIIISEDDPLDTPSDMQAFKAMSAGKRVTFLPLGGHLGYVNEAWTRAKLMTLFPANNANK